MAQQSTASNTQQLLFDHQNADKQADIQPEKRKLQLCNGYLLEFDKLSRVLHAIQAQNGQQRVKRDALVEATGLPDRQVETLVSMGTAMGLIVRGVQILSPVGALVADNDAFFEKIGTLEWCHYKGAGTRRNLVWFDIFNSMLPHEAPVSQAQCLTWFRQELAGQYSARSLQKVVAEEVRFVIDAYQQQRFSALGLLGPANTAELVVHRYAQFDPLVLSAMLYDYAEQQQRRILELSELLRLLGSPALIFGLDPTVLRSLVERLHDRGWLRYETTHNLDQLRLKPGFTALEFMSAFYDQRAPESRLTQERVSYD